MSKSVLIIEETLGFCEEAVAQVEVNKKRCHRLVERTRAVVESLRRWVGKFPDDVEHNKEALEKLEKCVRSARRVLELYGQSAPFYRLLLSTEEEPPVTFKGVNSALALCSQEVGLDANIRALTNETEDADDAEADLDAVHAELQQKLETLEPPTVIPTDSEPTTPVSDEPSSTSVSGEASETGTPSPVPAPAAKTSMLPSAITGSTISPGFSLAAAAAAAAARSAQAQLRTPLPDGLTISDYHKLLEEVDAQQLRLRELRQRAARVRMRELRMLEKHGSKQYSPLEGLSQELAEMVTQGVQFTVSAMKARLQDALLQMTGCRALGLLADSPKNDAELKEFQAVEAVLACMEAHRANAEVQERALHCLMMLSVNADLKIRFVSLSGLSHLIVAMTRHRDNANVCASACAVLQNVAVIAEFGDILLAQGIIALVFKTLGTHGDMEAVTKFACGALQNLSAHEHCRPPLVREGVIPLVLNVLLRQRGSADVQENCLGIIQNLAANTTVRKQLMDANCLVHIIAAMQAHMDSPDVVMQAMRCLMQLAANAPEYRRLIAQSGALTHIATALETHRNSSDVQRRGFSALQRLVGGYLTKRGKEMKTWKRRWFCIVPNYLCYFGREEDHLSPADALGRIPLRAIADVRVSSAFDMKDLFEVVTPGRVYYLSAESEADRATWMAVLRSVMGRTFRA